MMSIIQVLFSGIQNNKGKMEQNLPGIKTIGKYSYYLQKCLGQGSFGKVFQGFHNTTKQKVAIKKVDFKTIEKDSYLQKAIHEEIRIFKKFSHENIVLLADVLNSKRSLYIIMEYCKDGDLKKYLKTKKKLSENQAYEIMKQITKGYQQLAKQNTTHRDLKPANILVSNGLFKICDFGFSKVIKDPNTALKTCVGSPIYMAPQILQRKDYSAKCDIWSLGIIYYELLHGNVPWTARSEKQLLENIKNIPIRFNPALNLSSSLENMIRKMLQVREQKRANLQDLEKFFNVSRQTSLIIPNQDERTNFQKSYSTIPIKILNRHFFEELAWRYFVCIELKTRLPLLNRYNFTKNNFERLIVLILSSILSTFSKRYAQIQKIHERDVVTLVMKQYQLYQQFQKDYFSQLAVQYTTCHILKQFEFVDLFHNNYTQEITKKAQKLFFRVTHSLLKQLQQQLKIVEQKQQRKLLQYVTELILDLILINQKQYKTGSADISKIMRQKQSSNIERRISSKFQHINNITHTEMF